MAENVAAITELVEAIILHLPMKDIQRAQGVCRQWRNTVDSSIHLRRALFKQPGSAADLPYDLKLETSDKSALQGTAEGVRHCKSYGIHPIWDGPEGVLGKAVLDWCSMSGLHDVFITQPPIIAGLTSVKISSQTEEWHCSVRLSEIETFGSLHRKLSKPGIAAALDSGVDVEVEWYWDSAPRTHTERWL